MNEFKINKYIILRLEGSITVIYVKGKRFDQCKYLLFNIVKGDQMAKKIDSIDEMEEYLDDKLEYQEILNFDIEPEEEFQAHCSNIQAWAEKEILFPKEDMKIKEIEIIDNVLRILIE